MTGADLTTSFAAIFVDALAEAGVRHAVVAPGSRNTPLVLALARHPGIVSDVVLDERSAAFRALGIGIATGTPAVVCCTSGTAVANLHPAVIEAHHACVPLVVCTADRPPELRDWGAPQTIDVAGVFASAVRWYHDPGPPDDLPGAPARWRALAARAVDAALAPVPGPVHLNLPFREPLVPTGEPLLADTPDRRVTRAVVSSQLAPEDAARLVARIAATERGLVVAGFGARVDPQLLTQFSERSGWPVLADPVSNTRTDARAISTYDALARVDTFTRAYQPDLVLRVGAAVTSKATNAWLADVPTILIDPAHRWLDPTRSAVEHVGAGAEATLHALIECLESSRATDWCDGWRAADERARAALDTVLDEAVDCEARVARDLADAIPAGGSLVVSSSVPVRALEWSMRPRAGLHVAANRGANGIDGFVSTVGGVAAADSTRAVVGLIGDLGFLHDINGLAALGDAKLVVLDNNGGAIFSYLPPRDLPEFERLFTTPHHLDLVAVARAHGVDAERVEAPDDWAGLLKGGPPVVVVPLDAAAASARHQRMWDAVATGFGS